MKVTATVALALSLSVPSLYSQQRPIEMTFSGSMVATTLDLQPNSITDEEHLGGSGTFGQFTLRKLRIDGVTPRPSAACSGADHLNLPVLGGAGVFRFQDGSLLTAVITGGDLCIDFTAVVGHLTETYRITGGTGRFQGAAASCGATGSDCTFKSTATLMPVLSDASGAVKFLTTTGQFEGTVSGLAIGSGQ